MSSQVRIVRNTDKYPYWVVDKVLNVKVNKLSTGWIKVYATAEELAVWAREEDCEKIVNSEAILKVVENNLPKYENPPKPPEEISKPPLGLMPRYIHEEKRLKSVVEAVTRCFLNDKIIPIEWIEEYNELVTKINKK